MDKKTAERLAMQKLQKAHQPEPRVSLGLLLATCFAIGGAAALFFWKGF